MKLISCHIENFGKLSDLRVDFVEGINLFHEMNGWGKSTLAAFLRVMFYGFDSKKESGSFDKERVVYRPWQGGTYGGEVDFSYQGKVYRISRTFGKTEKTDAFHLYDLMTNLECHDFSSDIGTEIFGLDSASFKRSAFIAQNDCESGSTDGINAKLGNLAENTNDINNFDTAQKKIHDRMNKLSPDRATGSMKKRKNTITLLTEELRSYDAAEKAMEDLSARLADKQDQRKELSNIRAKYAKALQVASEESRREGLKQNYAVICEEEEQCKKNLKAYDEIFEKLWKGIPSCYRDYKQTKAHVYELKNYIDKQEKQISLCHIDSVPDNFLMTKDRIALIDWEYAGMQDTDVDLAMFIIYSMYGKEQADDLIDAYYTEGCKKEKRLKIYCYVAVCGLLWSNWCEVKYHEGVEFGEYSLRQYRYAKEYYKYVKEELENGL